jgi:putative ABC transport system permease protein
VREGLVVFQFAIAIAFTIGTCGIISQMHYLRTADLGFHRDGLIVVNSFDDSEVTGPERASLLQAWKAAPGVVADAAGAISPGHQDSTNGDNFIRPGMTGNGPTLQYVAVSPSFFDTYGARLIAGRLLSPARGGDDAPAPPAPGQPKLSASATPVRNVMVNEGAMRTMGFKSAHDALGQRLLEGADGGGFHRANIVGVVRDLHFLSPHDPVPPMLYRMQTRDIESALAGVRFGDADPKAVLARMESEWRRIVPGVPFRAKTIQDNLAPYYKPDDEHGRLFTLGAVLAVLIGCVGLYGLASFNTARRTKEIGIRKTLGASTGDILKLLIGQFLRPVLLANLVAWPLAYLAMTSWLSGFDQRIALSPLYFIAATVLALVIATLTVAGQAWRVAGSEPAKALRHE